MSGTAKEWGTLAELCLVLAGIPLAVMAPQVLWQVFGERRATGPLTPVSYTHLTLPTIAAECRSRWSPYH